MMRYIAAIDYEHLDNGVFLNTLAHSLSRQENVRKIIIHSDSEYTERVIQTGVMRDEARIRSIKDMNHRLVTLFADQGVSTIGINGYQRKIITFDGQDLQFDLDYLNCLPEKPLLLLSSLVYHTQTEKPEPVGLPFLMNALKDQLEPDEQFIFFRSDKDELFTENGHPDSVKWDELTKKYVLKNIPEEFHEFRQKIRITTAGNFSSVPDLSKTTLIQ